MGTSLPAGGRPRPLLLLGATLAVGLTLAPAAGADANHHHRQVAGAPGAGDAYFPLTGNGGIDVTHYDLDLRYTPPPPAPAALEGRLEGTATLDLTTTQDLDRFDLDLRGLTASAVTVDGRPAGFSQPADQVVAGQPNELVITPRRHLDHGDDVRVVITYAGTTRRPTDIGGALYGWVTTRDGAMVANEPDAAATWFPVNDTPTDKATYSFDVTVPEGLVAVANGVLEGHETADGWTTWSWDAPDAMAAYLATASVGNYVLHESTTPDGVPVLDAVDPDLAPADAATTTATLALTGDMLDYFEGVFGPYPFVAYGAIVDDDTIDYALETQTRSLFSKVVDETTAAHELSHSWMGDAVSPYRWSDIWLNEGWATYAEQLWGEHRGTTTTQQQFDELMKKPAEDPFWGVVVADPGAAGMFSAPVYLRGAATLHALRVKIGDDAFFRLAHRWVARHADGTASTADFEALAEKVSHQDLDAFFRVWLHDKGKPTSW